MFKELVHGERIVKAKLLLDSKSKKKSIKVSIQFFFGNLDAPCPAGVTEERH